MNDKNQTFEMDQSTAIAASDSSDRSKEKSLDQKILRRLAQNREAARKSRLRKKVLNMVCCGVEDPNSMANILHLSKIKDYLWVAEDGIKMKGYNGSQLWDVGFAVQAILSTGLVDEYGSMLKKAYDFIKISQVREDSPGNLSSWYRHISKGGWPFSTPDNGWPVSDCTAKGLKAALLLSNMPFDFVGEAISPVQLYDAVNWILSLQLLMHQLEPLTEQQLPGIYNLQQSSQQEEDALSQGMEAFQQSLFDFIAIAKATNSL